MSRAKGLLPVVELPPSKCHDGAGRGIGLAIINYNTSSQTIRCLDSLRRTDESPTWIFILDNASSEKDWAALRRGLCHFAQALVRLYRSEENLGFAAGSNFLIEELLDQNGCMFVMLLNNDAIAMPGGISCLVDALEDSGSTGLSGGRMHRLGQPDQVDTLGITLYRSLMPADRRALSDPYLGPTAGCCVLTRAALDHLKSVSGYFFDPRFFCYCEDTDLVLRACLLGYKPVFVNEVVALHEGQASSGGGYNRFIAYHGIRNSIWMIVKSIPTRLLVKYGPLLILAHLMTIARHLAAGSPYLLFQVYRDAFRALPQMLHDRNHLQSRALISIAEFDARIARSFYRRGYLKLVYTQIATFYRQKFFKI